MESGLLIGKLIPKTQHVSPQYIIMLNANINSGCLIAIGTKCTRGKVWLYRAMCAAVIIAVSLLSIYNQD